MGTPICTAYRCKNLHCMNCATEEVLKGISELPYTFVTEGGGGGRTFACYSFLDTLGNFGKNFHLKFVLSYPWNSNPIFVMRHSLRSTHRTWDGRNPASPSNIGKHIALIRMVDHHSGGILEWGCCVKVQCPDLKERRQILQQSIPH